MEQCRWSEGWAPSDSVMGSKVTVLWAVRMERFWAATVQVERPCEVAVTTLPSPSALQVFPKALSSLSH